MMQVGYVTSSLQSDGSVGDARNSTAELALAQEQPVVLRSAERMIESEKYDSDVQWPNDLVSEYGAYFEERSETAAGAAGAAGRVTKAAVRVPSERLDDFPEYICFPTPQRLAAADPQALKALGMPLKRAEALIHLANAALEGSLPMTIPGDVEQAMKTLQTFPGIGRWTANYFALRGWQAKDVFLPDDYLIKQRFPGMTPAQIRRYAERWKPWRSYALLHIWYTEGWQPDGTDEL